MKLKVDITDEALITALNTVGEIVVKNASLSLEDFKAWFNPVFDEYEAQHGQGVKASSLTFAVIQFTTFRY